MWFRFGLLKPVFLLCILTISIPTIAQSEDSTIVQALEDEKPVSPAYDSSCIPSAKSEEYSCTYYEPGNKEAYKLQTFHNGQVVKVWNMGQNPDTTHKPISEVSSQSSASYLQTSSPKAVERMVLIGFDWTPLIPKTWRGLRGIAAVRFGEKWMGCYLQGAFNEPVNESNSYDNLTKNPFGDSYKGKQENVHGISAGVAYPLNSVFVLTGGLGIWTTETFDEYYDESGILGHRGQYYAPDKSESIPFLQVGAIALLNQYVFIGASADVPLGASLSIGYNFINPWVMNR